jgi:hypothetical protein
MKIGIKVFEIERWLKDSDNFAILSIISIFGLLILTFLLTFVEILFLMKLSIAERFISFLWSLPLRILI